jgi:hypothetical protein
MSAIVKPNISNLEGKSNDYGDPILNNLFESLDDETKSKILKYPKKEIQISILRNISDPELKALWDSLSEKNKKALEKNGIRDKYIMLKSLLQENKNKAMPSEKELLPREAPQEIFAPEENEIIQKENVTDRKSPQIRLDDLIKTYYNVEPYSYDPDLFHELEVRFGTKGIKQLSRNDYDNVVKKLKSSGFTVLGENTGNYYLRVNCEFLDSMTGKFKMSDSRIEIIGLDSIQNLCKSNDIKSLYATHVSTVNFINKKNVYINNQKIFPVDVDDFNFRVSYQTEEIVARGLKMYIMENFKKSKKEFRFINRVSFIHPDYPCQVDVSITKFGNRGPDKYGKENRGPMIRVYTIEESNVFNNQENYEIEIELDNKKIGPSTKFDTPQKIATALRKVIKYVLSGLQQTNYPVSYPEQRYVIDSYMKMILTTEYKPTKFISSKNFIGPNSITLQLKNIAADDENSNEPNVRKDFVVTDKADGDRHLMFISGDGKIYLINTNMDVIFTGAKTLQKDCFNSILDGELIIHDKHGEFINLYAAFDIYYVKNMDIREYTFMLLDGQKDINKSRYQILKWFEYNLNPISIMDTGKKDVKGVHEILSQFGKTTDLISPIRFKVKEFFPNNKKQSIFEGCDSILQKEREGRFEYNTDGLIFTHAYYGVGSNEIGKAGPKSKITWENSFKWKPPQYNTVDFLVTTVKTANNEDMIKTMFSDGLNNTESVQFNEYKMIELRCGFKESKDGYINPCQDVIDDKMPEFNQRFEDRQDNDYIPMRFYPTEPYDANAGMCNIMLRMDGAGGKKMFSEENEVFEDNTIVEFRYDLDKESGWNWIPLRVRYDKTAKLRSGEKEYGNAYKVCNENWKSIHPSGRINEDMICTGLNIPSVSVSEDVYYNTPSGKFKTERMKDFHNLYVKKRLILGASKEGDTLIDFACGKAGDLSKWVNAKLSFVFGIDISKDNLENRLDGACARYLNFKKSKKNVPNALFVNGNSAYNIKDSSAMLSEKAKQITAAIFGKGSKEADKIGKGVAKQYGKGVDGFNVSSCQFAIHYFFKDPDILRGFMKNIAECTKQNGYFIGTCYDGKLVFNELRKTKTGDSIKIVEDDKKIWEITKNYGADTFDDDSSSIGYQINVYQESINQYISEYLVNFDYLNRVMSAYGFEIVNREEAQDMGLPDGTGLFGELFLHMLDEISKNKFKGKDFEQAPYMSSIEKKISFLNRYFIYKKVRTVNVENVELELGEYHETEALRNREETKEAQQVAVEEVKKSQPKVRKLTKKLLLIAATEAIEEPQILQEKEKKAKPKKDKKEKEDKVKPKALIIEEESDEEK